MNITLQAILVKKNELNDTIAEIEKRQESLKEELVNIDGLIAKIKAQSTEFRLPETKIELADGEHYAGIILGKDGEKSYHLILVPGEKEKINWNDAKAAGELPTRREQSLLFSNLKDQFESAWYWSSEQHAAPSHCAWGQDFSDGDQYDYHKGHELRARFVRRLVV